jgi:hypothetical protein
MQRVDPTVVKAEWVTRSPKDQQVPAGLVIENGDIAEVATVPVDAELIGIPEGIFPGFLKPHNRTINVSGNVSGNGSGNILAMSLAMIAKARAAVAKLWQQAKRRGHFAEAEPAGAEGRANGIGA